MQPDVKGTEKSAAKVDVKSHAITLVFAMLLVMTVLFLSSN
jgi:hypothetical protein